MHRFRMGDDIGYCRFDDCTIVLDIGADRYWQVSAALGAALDAVARDGGAALTPAAVERLIALGLVETGAAQTVTRSLPPTPRHSALGAAATAERLQPLLAAEVVATTLMAFLGLRWRGLARTLASLRRRRFRATTRDLDLEALARAFHRYRRWLPIRRVCLADSLAYLALLARRGAFPALVFGVEARPLRRALLGPGGGRRAQRRGRPRDPLLADPRHMSGARFCAILGGTAPAERQRWVGKLAARHGLVPAIDTGGLVIVTGDATRTTPVGTHGLVVGDAFGGPAAGASSTWEAAILGSNGRALGERCWGDHVAFVSQGSGAPITVLRSPSGGLHAYRARLSGCDVIASDVRYLLTLGVAQAIDWAFVADHLAYPHLRAHRTGLAAVDEIVAGDGVTFSQHGPERFGYWSPWRFTTPERRIVDHGEAAAAVRDAVLASTAALAGRYRHILLELSGGLDSSIVAAALAAARPDTTCVNFATPTAEGDERVYARAVADLTGLAMTEIEASDAIDLTKPLPGPTARPGLPGVLRSWEEGLIAIAGPRDIDAFFGGTGGDNVFCSLGSVAPAVDAVRAFGPGRQFGRTVAALATIHHATTWSVGWRAIRQSMRPAKRERWPRANDLLRPEVLPVVPPAHPWLGDDVDTADAGTRAHVRSIMAAQASRRLFAPQRRALGLPAARAAGDRDLPAHPELAVDRRWP
ncbi:asparagine synthase-related protein [Sphingomonas sp. 1P08PE]|uniref:asparagine synthase-related protein n=1 Tax=Sphingomonas sp. 1P08PE TaxID=554122 RepID=UPI0039A2136D